MKSTKISGGQGIDGLFYAIAVGGVGVIGEHMLVEQVAGLVGCVVLPLRHQAVELVLDLLQFVFGKLWLTQYFTQQPHRFGPLLFITQAA
ncbi:hypothetical protein D3C76_1040950 [compost metagenome]